MHKEDRISLYPLYFVFFCGSVLQGFYREPNLFIGVIVPLAVLAYSLAAARSGKALDIDFVDIFALVFYLSYLASTFRAGDLHEAVVTDLRLAGYLALYFWYRFCRPQPDFLQRLGFILFSSAVVCSMLTWLAAWEVWKVEGVYAGEILQTTFEYKNTGAIFLALALSLGQWLFAFETRLKWEKVVQIAASALIFVTLCGTQSRTVWLLFALQTMILLWLFRRQLPSSLTYYAAVVFPSLIGGSFALRYLNEGFLALSFFAVGSSIAGSVLLYLLLDRFCAKANLPSAKLMGLFGGAALVILIFGLSMSNGPLAKLAHLSLDDSSLRERYYLIQDAWKIIRQNIWVGAGGQGWDAYYLKYQTYAYYAENIHNMFLQTWLEAGIFGLLAFSTIMGLGLAYSLRIRTEEPPLKILVIFFWMLCFHSIVDFDLSFGEISLLFWLCLAVIANEHRKSSLPVLQIKLKGYCRQGIIFGCGALVIFAGILLTARLWFEQSKQLLAEGNTEGSIISLQRSLSLDPYNINTLVRLAQLNLRLAQFGPDYIARSIGYGEKAVAVKPSEPMGHYVLGQAYLTVGKVDLGLEQLELNRQYHPNLLSAYEDLTQAYLAAAKSCLVSNEKQRALGYLACIKPIVDIVKQKSREYPPDVFAEWDDEPVLKVSPLLMQNEQEAAGLLKSMSGSIGE